MKTRSLGELAADATEIWIAMLPLSFAVLLAFVALEGLTTYPICDQDSMYRPTNCHMPKVINRWDNPFMFCDKNGDVSIGSLIVGVITFPASLAYIIVKMLAVYVLAPITAVAVFILSAILKTKIACGVCNI